MTQILEVLKVEDKVNVGILKHLQPCLLVHNFVVEGLEHRLVDRDDVGVVVAVAFFVAAFDDHRIFVDVAAGDVVLNLKLLVEIDFVAWVVALDRVDVLVAVDGTGTTAGHVWFEDIGLALSGFLGVTEVAIPA